MCKSDMKMKLDQFTVWLLSTITVGISSLLQALDSTAAAVSSARYLKIKTKKKKKKKEKKRKEKKRKEKKRKEKKKLLRTLEEPHILNTATVA